MTSCDVTTLVSEKLVSNHLFLPYYHSSSKLELLWLRSVEMHCHFSAHLKKVHLLDKGCHEFRPSLFFVFFPRRIEMVWQDLTCFTTFSYATSSLHSGAAICTHIERIYDGIAASSSFDAQN